MHCTRLHSCLSCACVHPQSAGELQNDEETAAIILQMVLNSGKLMNSLSSERRGSFHRMSGALLLLYQCFLEVLLAVYSALPIVPRYVHV